MKFKVPTFILLLSLIVVGCSQSNVGVQVSEILDRLDKTESKLREATNQIKSKSNEGAALERRNRELNNDLIQQQRINKTAVIQIKKISDENSSLRNKTIAAKPVLPDSFEQENFFGIWTFDFPTLDGGREKFRIVILKPVGAKNSTELSSAEVLFGRKKIGYSIYHYASGLRTESVGGRRLLLQGIPKSITNPSNAVSLEKEEQFLLMEFVNDDKALIWPQEVSEFRLPHTITHYWPKNEFGQAVQIEVHRAIEERINK
ncbi:hypothetical protein N9B71_01300 [Pirellulales bacterium]|nr:hypothetical protein [Pirellulales bacterium]